MSWTANYTVNAGETSGGLIVGSNGIPDAVASNMIVFGVANDFIVSHGGILRASSGGVTNGAQIVGTTQAQEIIEHQGVANDTVVDNAAGYMWQRGSSYRAVVKKGHQSLVGANARSWDTIVDGGDLRVSASGAIAYNTVISGGRMQVYAGTTVDGVTIMVGNGKNAVLRPEADGATYTGDICMDLTTAVTVTTTSNYFISSVSRVAASSGVTFSIKVKEYDQLAGEYCVGGGTTNITATVKTDTGKTLGTISRGSGNPSHTHMQYGAFRLYTDVYLYLSVVTGAAVFNGTTVVAQGKVLEDVTVGNGQLAYVYAEGSALRMTLNDAPLRVWGEVTSTTVNGTGAVVVSSGGVAKNTLVNANSQYVYAGGSALDTVVRGGILQLHDVGAYANNVTVYGGDARLVLDVNGAQMDGNVNIDISQIAADNTSGNTFINSLSRVLNYTPHGVTFTVTVAEEGQRAGNYFYAGNLNNFTATVVTDTGKTLGTINGVSTTGGSGAWLHTKYGSYRFYNDTYVMLGVVDGHPVELWNGNTLEASGDSLSDQSVTVGKTMFVYENGAATGNTVDGGALLISEGGVATGNTVVSGSAVALSGGVMSGTIANGSMAFIRVYSGGVASDNRLVVSGARELIYSGGTALKTSLTVAGAYQNVGDYMAGVDNTGTLALDTEIAAGAFQNVYSGAVASRTTITGAGASQVINADAAARDTVASTGIVRVVGQTTSTTLRGDAQELLSAATARASGTVISGGAQKLLSAGAKAYDVVISGGTQLLSVAGTEAYRTVVSASMLDNTAGRTESTTIHGAGREMVRNGATAYYTVLESDVTTGNQFVRAGGVTYYTTVRAGAQQLYDATATAYDTVVSGGEQQVFAGASAVRTVLSNGKIQNGGGLVVSAELFGAAANRLYVSNGGSASLTVLHDNAINDVTSGTVISTTLYDSTQELLRSGGVASGAIVSGGAQKVLSAGAVASDTIVYAGYQQVVAGASAWNTTIVAGVGNGYVSLAEGAVTGGTWNFDLSQGYQAGQMLNAWYISSGTDLVITVSADDQPLGKYLLSNNAGGYNNETFTVKDTTGYVYGSIHAGETVDVGGNEYTLKIDGGGLYFVTGSFPVEIYTSGVLTDYGVTVSGAKIVAGMSAFVNDGGTLADAAIIKANSNKVIVSSGGKITGAEVYGFGTGTDIRVSGGGSASGTYLADDRAYLRLYGGTGYDTTVVGGQFLMYAGAYASNTTVIAGGVQKLLLSGTTGVVVASNTTVSSGGWIQVGATLEQTKGSYFAGGDITTVNVLSGGTMFVEVGATAADVTLHAGASAYVYSGGQIAFTTIESDARVNVRFSQATGNTEALVTGWGTVAAGAELSVKEVGGAGTFKIADSIDANITAVDYDEFDVFGGRIASVGSHFSDVFEGLDYITTADGTLTATALTVGTQATAATLDDNNATTLADGALATTWTANTDLSTIPVVAGANTNADAWLTLDGTTVNGALYGADGNFANDVNLHFRDGSIKNLAAGATAGGSVANVNVMIGDIDPDWTVVSHGTTFTGVAYAGGFGSVVGTAGTVINDGTFAKDFYAGALANKLDAVTGVGEVNMTVNGGTFSGNIYGASAVKTVAGKNGLRHSVGDVTLTLAGGSTTKGTQACIFAGGYATGDATGTVYTVESVTLDVSSGNWGTACGGRGVFGGIMASGVTAQVTGDVNITISGDAAMGNVYGGGWAQKGGTSIVGDVNISISGGTIANVFGGGSHSSSGGTTTAGAVTITVSGGTISGDIYARGQLIGDATGTAEVIFTGAADFACGVYGYSYVASSDASDATLSFTGYTGSFAGAIGGFDSITLDGITAMTLTAAAEDVSNSAWTFDVAARSTAFADTALLNWTAADFTGDTITLNLASGDANEWSLVGAATTTAYNKFDVLVDGTSILSEAIDLDQAISGGAYDGWGFTNDEGTLKFKQLA